MTTRTRYACGLLTSTVQSQTRFQGPNVKTVLHRREIKKKTKSTERKTQKTIKAIKTVSDRCSQCGVLV